MYEIVHCMLHYFVKTFKFTQPIQYCGNTLFAAIAMVPIKTQCLFASNSQTNCHCQLFQNSADWCRQLQQNYFPNPVVVFFIDARDITYKYN